MNNEERGIIFPEKEAVIKVRGQERGHGRTPSHLIPFWTKRGWRAAYWWHSRWQSPDLRSPRWLAVGCALLLVMILAAVSAAHDGEVALRQRAAGMRGASSENSVTGASQTAATPALSGVEVAVPPSIYATGSAIYIVQPEDTLYRIASSHNTTMEALDQINRLNSTVSVGQVLVIPSAGLGAGTTAVPTDHYACTQFSFHQGGRSAQAGVYALHDVTGGQIAAWSAPAGAMASGWIYDLPVAFASVHARVLFYPRYGGGTAVEMTILNHAPDTSAGWLTRGLCHSLELAFPGG